MAAIAAVVLQSSLSILVPTFASAAPQPQLSGSGTTASPYQITNCSELAEISTKPAANYVLSNDITCSTGWSAVNLSGGLDGRNHTISGLDDALFSTLSGTVKNLNLTGLTVSGQTTVGGLADSATAATITNVNASGDIAGESIIGGLIGQASNATTISQTSFSGTVSGTGTEGAGLIGVMNSGSVSNSYADATVSGFDKDAGLIDNINNVTVSNSYAVGTISATSNDNSGFVEQSSSNDSSNINNSFSGVSTSQGTISPFGSELASTTQVSGFVYDQSLAGGANCGITSGCTAVDSTGTDAGHFKNTQSVAPFTSGWDFTKIWKQTSGYPTLQPAPVTSQTPAVHTESGGTYTISSCEDLENMSNDLSGSYTLSQNIDCSMTNPANENYDPSGIWNDGTGFHSIGSFSGTLDGNGYTIDGLYINNPTSGAAAIMDELMSGGVVQNLNITNETVTNTGDCAGLVAFANTGSLIDNVNIASQLNCSEDSGGIAAAIYSNGPGTATISNSTASPTFNTTDGNNDQASIYWGGIVGYVELAPGQLSLTSDETNPSVNNSLAQYVGGVIGGVAVSDGGYISIYDSGSDGTISCDSYCGGLIGDFGSTSTNSMNIPGMTLSSDYSSEPITGVDSNIGGLIGSIENDLSSIEIDHSAFFTPNGGSTTNGDNMGGLVGEDTAAAGSTLTIDQSFVFGGLIAGEENIGFGSNVGGLIGYTTVDTTITNSFFDGVAVADNLYGGGLVGQSTANLDITDSYAGGSLGGGDGSFTGAAGGPSGGLVGSMYNGKITDSVANIPTGTIGGTVDAAVGEITGTLDPTSSVYIDAYTAGSPDCYSTMVNDATCNVVDTDGTNADYFMNNTTNPPLNDWDFNSTWEVESSSMPILSWFFSPPPPPPSNVTVSSCADLENLSNTLNANVTMTQNIDCSDTPDFTPIGSGVGSFTGTFDGGGYSITGINIEDPGGTGDGLFAALDGADVHNLFISGAIQGGADVGALAGSASDATTISQVGSSTYVTSTTGDATGGLIGHSNDSTIDQSYATGDVDGGGQWNGGLIGLSEADTITNSYARGNVSGIGYYNGGFIGASNDDIITNTYSTGNVSGETINGGFIGYNTNGTRINYSFSTGLLVTPDGGNTDYDSGFVGADFANTITYNHDVYNEDTGLYCSMDDSHNIVALDDCGEVSISQNPQEFMTANDNPVSNWDLGGIWHLNTNDYPTLSPLSSPVASCPSPTVTDTSMSISCSVSPAGWGATTWEMQYQPVGGSSWTDITLSDPAQGVAEVDALTPSTPYTVQVRFTDDSGTSDWLPVDFTTTAATITPPIAPPTAPVTPVTTPTSAGPILSTFLASVTPVDTTPAAPSDVYLNSYSDYSHAGMSFGDVTLGEVFHFNLVHNGVTEQHTATVKSIGPNYIVFTIASNPFDLTVYTGQSALVSVHQDGHSDLKITLGAITGQTAQVTFKALLSRTADVTKTSPQQTDYVWLWLLLIFVPIIAYAIAARRRDN